MQGIQSRYECIVFLYVFSVIGGTGASRAVLALPGILIVFGQDGKPRYYRWISSVLLNNQFSKTARKGNKI